MHGDGIVWEQRTLTIFLWKANCVRNQLFDSFDELEVEVTGKERDREKYAFFRFWMKSKQIQEKYSLTQGAIGWITITQLYSFRQHQRKKNNNKNKTRKIGT